MLRVIGCITQEHDPRLVVLAACLCALSCFTTFNLIARAQAAGRSSSWIWLIAAAGVFGCGVWSLHFVAMLAFMPGMPIAYDIQTTILSVVVVVTGALIALLAWRLVPSRPAGIGLGGTLLGLAVAGMHYCGVEAMRLPGSFGFDHRQMVASVLISIGFATLSLARAGSLVRLRRRLEVSVWLAACVCGMHFTGMSALVITAGLPMRRAGALLGSGWLAVAVGSVSLALLVVSLAATIMAQHLTQRMVLELRRMQLLADISQEILIIHRDGIVLQANAAGGRMFGVAIEQMVGRAVPELFSASGGGAVMRHADLHPAELHPNDPGSAEVQLRTPTGTLVPMEVASSIIEHEGRPAIATALRDLSDRKRHEERIRHLAHHDALTDLPNRFLLQERLAHALDAAAYPGTSVALLYLDLDRFKPVNELLGQTAGDALLVQVATRLRARLRSTDTLARVGGDEFVIVATAAHPGEVATLAARLIGAIAQPFDLAGRQVGIGVSIGIALYPGDSTVQETLMQAAETALDSVKAEKPGSFRFFEAAMDDHLHARRQLEQDLRHAVDRDELQLHYQPLLNGMTGETEGFEALLRWYHPERGLVSPADFIPLAEETGLIVGIGRWVIETACDAAAGWNKPWSVAVNVSPVQFRQSDVPQIVSDALARTGLQAGRLEIEITEGVLMEDTRRAVDVLSALRGKGVRIALDDFGTGYSSLSYLRSFRFDKLKIDRSFVSELSPSSEAAVIVRTIIGLAHNLGIAAVAEGVETSQQLAILRDHGCDQVQGFLLGKPTQMGDFNELAMTRARLLLLGCGASAGPVSLRSAAVPRTIRNGLPAADELLVPGLNV